MLSITPELLDDTLHYLGDLFGWHCPNGKSEGARIAVPVSAQHHLEQALTAQPKPQEPELFIKLGEACDAQATPEGYDAALQVTAPQHYALPKTDDSLRLPAL